MLAAYDISLNFDLPDPVKVFTFGSPRVGNLAFATVYNSRCAWGACPQGSPWWQLLSLLPKAHPEKNPTTRRLKRDPDPFPLQGPRDLPCGGGWRHDCGPSQVLLPPCRG